MVIQAVDYRPETLDLEREKTKEHKRIKTLQSNDKMAPAEEAGWRHYEETFNARFFCDGKSEV